MFSRANLSWLILYCAFLVLVGVGLSRARQQAIRELATHEAQSEWDGWRAEATRQSEGRGPVARRVPKSAEPPELVLLRDYFWVCFVGLALLSSALFASVMFLVRGVAGGPKFSVKADSRAASDSTGRV